MTFTSKWLAIGTGLGIVLLLFLAPYYLAMFLPFGVGSYALNAYFQRHRSELALGLTRAQVKEHRRTHRYNLRRPRADPHNESSRQSESFNSPWGMTATPVQKRAITVKPPPSHIFANRSNSLQKDLVAQVISSSLPPSYPHQYRGVGVFPTINLNKVELPFLSPRNSNMVHRPVTVKIAPPGEFFMPSPKVHMTGESLHPQVPPIASIMTALSNSSRKRSFKIITPPVEEGSKRPRCDSSPSGPNASVAAAGQNSVRTFNGMLYSTAKVAASPCSDNGSWPVSQKRSHSGTVQTSMLKKFKNNEIFSSYSSSRKRGNQASKRKKLFRELSYAEKKTETHSAGRDTSQCVPTTFMNSDDRPGPLAKMAHFLPNPDEAGTAEVVKSKRHTPNTPPHSMEGLSNKRNLPLYTSLHTNPPPKVYSPEWSPSLDDVHRDQLQHKARLQALLSGVNDAFSAKDKKSSLKGASSSQLVVPKTKIENATAAEKPSLMNSAFSTSSTTTTTTTSCTSLSTLTVTTTSTFTVPSPFSGSSPIVSDVFRQTSAPTSVGFSSSVLQASKSNVISAASSEAVSSIFSPPKFVEAPLESLKNATSTSASSSTPSTASRDGTDKPSAVLEPFKATSNSLVSSSQQPLMGTATILPGSLTNKSGLPLLASSTTTSVMPTFSSFNSAPSMEQGQFLTPVAGAGGRLAFDPGIGKVQFSKGNADASVTSSSAFSSPFQVNGRDATKSNFFGSAIAANHDPNATQVAQKTGLELGSSNCLLPLNTNSSSNIFSSSPCVPSNSIPNATGTIANSSTSLAALPASNFGQIGKTFVPQNSSAINAHERPLPHLQNCQSNSSGGFSFSFAKSSAGDKHTESAATVKEAPSLFRFGSATAESKPELFFPSQNAVSKPPQQQIASFEMDNSKFNFASKKTVAAVADASQTFAVNSIPNFSSLQSPFNQAAASPLANKSSEGLFQFANSGQVHSLPMPMPFGSGNVAGGGFSPSFARKTEENLSASKTRRSIQARRRIPRP